MSNRILNELHWVSEIEDIDHEICDIARDAADEIRSLIERLHILATEVNVLHAELAVAREQIHDMEVERDIAEHGGF